MTANAMREQALECIEAGMDSVLAKPTTIDQIRTAVVQHSGRRFQVQDRLSSSQGLAPQPTAEFGDRAGDDRSRTDTPIGLHPVVASSGH